MPLPASIRTARVLLGGPVARPSANAVGLALMALLGSCGSGEDPAIGRLAQALASGASQSDAADDGGLARGEPRSYVVRLREDPLATYGGGVAGLAATRLRSGVSGQLANATARGRLNVRSAASRAYLAHLRGAHERLALGASGALGREFRTAASFRLALNAVVADMTAAEAARVAQLPQVASVQPNEVLPLLTARTPEFISADAVWSGEREPGIVAMGEGMLIGVIDSGINFGHPSFAEVGADGYRHENPLGEGVYLGECSERPGLCNAKLVGAHFLVEGRTDPLLLPGDPLTLDTNGHGSHVASTAAGNFVADPIVFGTRGQNTGLSVGGISGVAPHASLIAYKACLSACVLSDAVRAIEQAIEDGVDVLNHSIGSPALSPWGEVEALAFLNARAAGIIVVNAAGNVPGLGQASVSGNAPWVTSVAHSTHDRGFRDKSLSGLSGGEGQLPTDLRGLGLSGEIAASIVYAGDFESGERAPEQCAQPFPAGTFAGQIVVCDNAGTQSRLAGCSHAAAGGAGGCVLANVAAGDDRVLPLAESIPAIHIGLEAGQALRRWLQSGEGHRAAVGPSSRPYLDAAVADRMASDASAGPFFDLNLLVPSLAAPGVSILAAGADLQFEHPGTPAGAGPYSLISGSSMASPHVAGASALLAQLHRDWTPAEILSALMTTAETNLRLPDGSPASPYHYGGGRIRVDRAARAGLVLDESPTSFLVADPSLGGDPSALNLAGLVMDPCPGECRFERRLRATRSATWHAVVEGDMAAEIVPSEFSLSASQRQAVGIRFTAGPDASGEVRFGRVRFVPDDPSVPDAHLSYVVRPVLSRDPELLRVTVDRSEARPGDLLTYTLHAHSPSVGRATLGSVVDVLPPGLELVEGSARARPQNTLTTSEWVYEQGQLGWAGIFQPATASLQVAAAAPVESFISLGALGIEPLPCAPRCDESGIPVEGLALRYFGRRYERAIVSTNGALEVGDASGDFARFNVVRLPNPASANNLVAPLWADFDLGRGGAMYAGIVSPDGGATEFDVISWEQVALFRDPAGVTDPRYSFQVWAQRNAERLLFVYGRVPADPDPGSVGFEGPSGAVGASAYFDGVGELPVEGRVLEAQTQPAGSAQLQFQVRVTEAALPGPIVNRAQLVTPGARHVASAITELGLPD